MLIDPSSFANVPPPEYIDPTSGASILQIILSSSFVYFVTRVLIWKRLVMLVQRRKPEAGD